MKCTESCRLFGAYQALGGIKGNLILLHSVVGCHFSASAVHFHHNMAELNSCCTVISDDDIIFNGERKLEAAIEHAIKFYHPDSITVVTGCVSDMIGDDIQAVADRYADVLPVYWTAGAGFSGGFEDGYEDAFAEYVTKTCRGVEKTPGCRINLLGLLYDDFKLEADIKEIRRVLGSKVTVNCVPAASSTCGMERLADADLNVVFGRGEKAALYLKENFGMPYITLDYPYGIEGGKSFLKAMEDFFPVDYTQEKAEMERAAVAAFERGYYYLSAFYGLPVGILATTSRAGGLRRFLTQELGMEAVACMVAGRDGDMEAFIEEARAGEAALIVGSSYAADAGYRIGAPVFPCEYPVFDRVSLSDSPYVMGRGAVCMAEDLINLIMICKNRENRGALYYEKDLHLR